MAPTGRRLFLSLQSCPRSPALLPPSSSNISRARARASSAWSVGRRRRRSGARAQQVSFGLVVFDCSDAQLAWLLQCLDATQPSMQDGLTWSTLTLPCCGMCMALQAPRRCATRVAFATTGCAPTSVVVASASSTAAARYGRCPQRLTANRLPLLRLYGCVCQREGSWSRHPVLERPMTALLSTQR